MPCPHSQRDTPDRCSQCLGAPVRRIEQSAAALLIDGMPAGRPIDVESQSAQRKYATRGGNARARRTS
jgi:hypothetical protein